MSPLACFPHDWTEPYAERVSVTRTSRFPLTRIHYIQRCIQCGETRECWPEHHSPQPGRVQQYELHTQDAQEAP